MSFFPESLPATAGTVVAIGNFDGVHAGHRSLLAAAHAEATRQGVPLVALTFEPHPRSVLFPHTPLHRLTNLEEKAALLHSAGATGVAVFPFTHENAQWSPTAFMETILHTWLNARAVFVGANFHFGHKAAGTPQTLAQNPHFTTHIVPLLTDATGEVLSSRRLRAALSA